MEVRKVEVSLFNGVDPNPSAERISLKEIFAEIADDNCKKEVDMIRHFKKEGASKEVDRLKKELWAFTPSGIFTQRKKDQLIEYTGIICLDYDNIPETDLGRIRMSIQADPYTLSCFLSPSGQGLKVFSFSPGTQDVHENAFKEIDGHYAQKLGLKSDQGCKDITRLCFGSYDPDLYLNWDAVPFKLEGFPTGPVHEKYKNMLNKCKSFTDNLEVFASGNRNKYVHQFASNANRYNIPIEEVIKYCFGNFVENDFATKECEDTIKSAYNNTAEMGKFSAKEINHTPLSVIELIEQNNNSPEVPAIWSGITQPSLGFLYGPSKSGKSTLSESLGMSIALGRSSFLDKPMDGPRKVLLVSLEEYPDLRTKRLRKQIQVLNHKETSLLETNYIISPRDFPKYIISDNEWDKLRKLIGHAQADVVFIDSLSHINPGSPIEDSSTASSVMKKFRDLADDLNIAIILIHHTPKDVSEGKPLGLATVAGSRILLQEAEFIFGVNKTPADKRYFKTVALRYVEEDDLVTTFRINEHGWTEKISMEKESSLLLDFDGRSDKTNYNMIQQFISEKREVSISALEKKFVSTDGISRATLYKNLQKLIRDEKIRKAANGLYLIKYHSSCL